MNFIDICAGIGGFRSGLERAGHKCIGWVEIDKYARKSYEEMYDTTGEWTAEDITKIEPEEILESDIWCFGFPCQDISVAGKQRGLSGERSGIFYNIIGLLKSKDTKDKPEWLLVENVKNLLSIKGGGGQHLPKFSLKYQKQGTTQNGYCLIPKTLEYHRTGNVYSLSDILEKEVDEKFYLSQEQIDKLIAKHKLNNKHAKGRKSPSDK